MEGVTFRSPSLANVMRDKVVESRLHLDVPERIDPEKLPLHERVRDELVHQRGAPNYAILDPETGEFLYRIRGVPGGDYDALRDNFLKMFQDLPAKQKS